MPDQSELFSASTETLVALSVAAAYVANQVLNVPFDRPLGNTGLYWAGRTRAIIENLGKRTPSRAGRDEVEKLLVTILKVNGEKALNELRDQAISIGLHLGKAKEVKNLRTIIGALLGSQARRELRTREGRLVAQGTPMDYERMARFEVLAGCTHSNQSTMR